MAGFLDTLTIGEDITALYIGYFNVAPTPEGFAHWQQDFINGTTNLGQTPDQALTAISDNFAMQQQALSFYPFLSTPTPFNPNNTLTQQGVEAFVSSIFQNLFDITPSQSSLDTGLPGHGPPSGAGYWVSQILNNVVPVGRAVLLIMNGVQANTTAEEVLSNKIEVGLFFETQLAAAGMNSDSPHRGATPGGAGGCRIC